MSKVQTYYEKLDLSETATLEEVKKAWKKLSLANHPDKAPPGKVDEYTAKFQDLSNAYITLLSPDLRAKHDEELRKERGGPVTQGVGSRARPRPTPNTKTSTSNKSYNISNSPPKHSGSPKVPPVPPTEARPSGSTATTPRASTSKPQFKQDIGGKSNASSQPAKWRPPGPQADLHNSPMHDFVTPFAFKMPGTSPVVSSFTQRSQPSFNPNPSIEAWMNRISMPDISHASPKEQSQPLKDAEGQSGPRQSRHPDSQTGAGSARKRSTSHSGVTTSFARKSRPYSSQADIQSDLGDSDADSSTSASHSPSPSCVYYPNEDIEHVQLIMPGATRNLEHSLKAEDMSFLQLTKLVHQHGVDLVQYPFIRRRDSSYMFEWEKFGLTKVILKR